MILATRAQQLKGSRMCGDEEGPALEEFMLKGDRCLVLGSWQQGRLKMPGSGRLILSGFYYYLLIKIQMAWKAHITQPDLQLGHLLEYFRQNCSFSST